MREKEWRWGRRRARLTGVLTLTDMTFIKTKKKKKKYKKQHTVFFNTGTRAECQQDERTVQVL